MNTTLSILGLAVPVRYEYLGPDSIQWFLDKDAEEMNDPLFILAETLLRTHHNEEVLKLLGDELQAARYEADAKAAALAEDYPF